MEREYKVMGLTDKIRNAAKNSGANKAKLFYCRDGSKIRVRFLQELDDGYEILFHDSYEKGVNSPCQEQLGKNCPLCGDDSLRTREMYAFSVWNYDIKEVQIMLYAANNFTPLPAIAACSENYGAITDRDYVIECRGKQQNKTFSVIPQDKVKFRNDKAKPYTKSAILKIVDKAFPMADGTGGNIDYEGNDYDEMSVQELYKLCKERDIDVEPRKDKDYYIDRLNDSKDDDSGWEDEDEEEKGKYDGMSAKELYKLCKERDIDAEQRKPDKYYVNLLEEDDKAEDDWGDTDETESEGEDLGDDEGEAEDDGWED